MLLTTLRLHSRIVPALLVASAILVTARLSDSQTNTAARPKFDVISIRPCDPNTDVAGGRGRGGASSATTYRFRRNCVTARSLIQDAYVRFAGTPRSPMAASVTKVEGAPAWVDSDQYTIEAESGTNFPNAVMAGPMTQALLEDRFQLKIRREIRNDPVYELSIAKGGSKVKPAKAGPCVYADFLDTTFPSFVRADLQRMDTQCRLLQNVRKGANVVMVVRSIGMDEITDDLSIFMDRSVIDKTGIAGNVDFRVMFGPDERTPGVTGLPKDADTDATVDDPTGPSIFTAFQKQLGLNLNAATGAREHFVIESISRPSPN